MLGENITEEEERYRFTWVGKNKAIQEPNIPTTSTLRPDKDSSKNWDTTENLYIEGDNLEVLKILQNSYNGKIKMIYIDPPYNTGSDFIYKDDFTLTMEEVEKQEGLRDKKGATKTVDRLTKNTKDSAKYHTNWLNMMYPRLSIARDLLTDDGVVFISIDDSEQENLKKICNEIFGEENFIDILIWKKLYGGKNDSKWFSHYHDYILVYAKNKLLFYPKLLPRDEKQNERYKNPDNDIRGPWTSSDFSQFGPTPNCVYEIITPNGTRVFPKEGKRWITTYDKYLELRKENRLWFGESGGNVPRLKRFLSEVKLGVNQSTFLDYIEVGHSDEANKELKDLLEKKVFDYPKPVRLLKRLSFLGSDKDSIILDFFSGSATTAHAVMQLNAEDGGNRKFIMVQLPEECAEKSEEYKNICELGKERIRRAGEKILEDNKDKDLSSLDIGFKTFKVDSSNFNEWDISYEAMVKAVKESAEGKYTTYKQDRSELDLVYEIMLKEGLQLIEEVEEIDFEGVTIYKIANGVIYIFLGKLTKEIVDKIIEMKKEVQELFGLDNPTVILNETYLDSEIKANAKENFISNGIVNIKTL